MNAKRKLLADWMKAQTSRLRVAYPSPADDSPGRPTSVQREARAALAALPIEAREPMRRLLCLVSGVDIPIPSGPRDAHSPERTPFQVTHIEGGEVVVPLNTVNGHNYAVGQPTMLMPGRFRGVRHDSGMLGNTLSNARTDIRIATDDEIERFASIVPLGSDAGETFGLLCSLLSFIATRNDAEARAAVASISAGEPDDN